VFSPSVAGSFHMLFLVLSQHRCCSGQIRCKITPLAELFSLPAPYPDFMRACTNITRITKGDRKGSDKTGFTASPPWRFWFRCASDYHLREGGSLNICQSYAIATDKCVDCWKVREGEVNSGKKSWYFRFQGVRKFLFYLVLICKWYPDECACCSSGVAYTTLLMDAMHFISTTEA